MSATLTAEEILTDVLDAFKSNVPGLKRMSTDFRADSLKLNKQYDAHIALLPEVSEYDANNGGYQNDAQNVRDLLVDVPVTVDQHPKVSVQAKHLESIQDDKQEYGKVIGNMGFSLAKNFTNTVLAKFNSRNLSQSSVYTTGNSDYDALEAIQTKMNKVDAGVLDRVGIVNSDVASAIGLDNRILSGDFRGEMQGASALRNWKNIAGFSEVQEWSGLPTNNGAAIAVTIEADDDVVTTASAHSLLVGDRVVFDGLTGGAGLTDGTIYYVVSVPSVSTLTVSATAGGSAVNVSTDYSAGTIARVENLTGAFFEPRAVSILSGIPDDFDQAAQRFGAPATYGVTVVTDPDTGLTFAMIAESKQGTLDGFLHITHVYGASVGKQASTAETGSITDYAGHRLISA